MDENQFWEIIEKSKQGSNGSQEIQEKKLRAILDGLTTEQIAGFDQVFGDMLAKSYTWDLWGAAYLINGGCSDDGFEYFRRGLIAEGQQKFNSALEDTESLAGWAMPDEMEFEGIRYVIDDAYRAKTGTKDFPPNRTPYPKEPLGESWEEDELEERFPELARKFSDR